MQELPEKTMQDAKQLLAAWLYHWKLVNDVVSAADKWIPTWKPSP